MKLLRISLTITFFLTFLLVSAQNHQRMRGDRSQEGPNHFLNNLEKLKTDLNLTNEQIASIKKLKEEMEIDLKELKEAEGDKASKITEFRELQKSVHVQMEEILTADQQAKLKEIRIAKKKEIKARIDAMAIKKAEIKESLESYKKENITPVLQTQRAKLEPLISKEHKESIENFREVMKVVKEKRETKIHSRKNGKQKDSKPRSAENWQEKAEERGKLHEELVQLVKTYKSDIDQLFDGIKSEEIQWKLDIEEIMLNSREMGIHKEGARHSQRFEKKGEGAKRGGHRKYIEFLLLEGIETTAKVSNALATTVLSVFPVPAQNIQTLKYKVVNSGIVNITLLSAEGKSVNTYVNKYHAKGDYEMKVNLSNLPKGMYIYRVEDSDGIGTHKIVKE